MSASEMARKDAEKDPLQSSSNSGADELRLLIERWERLNEEKQAIADDQKDVMAEAKSRGFDTKTIRRVIAARKQAAEDRAQAEALFETYMAALGLL